jgi:hypothetical protein
MKVIRVEKDCMYPILLFLLDITLNENYYQFRLQLEKYTNQIAKDANQKLKNIYSSLKSAKHVSL